MPTHQETLSQMAEVLFDNTDNIPEGVYLRLMNLCRDMSRVLPPPQPVPVLDFKPIYWVKYAMRFEDQIHPIHSVFEVLDTDTPLLKTFYQVNKTNDKSIVVDIYKFEACWSDDSHSSVCILRTETFNKRIYFNQLKERLVRESGSTRSFNRLRSKVEERQNQVPIPVNQIHLWEFNKERIEAEL